MPATITTQNTAEVAACLTSLGIWSYGIGGKQQAAYQDFYQICMATLSGATVIGTPTAPRARQLLIFVSYEHVPP